jgi:phosphatidylinositol 4-kinase type 2
MRDADFQERMYAKQLAVMKGQAWNVVETLKTPDHGPLELTRRARVCVWDDLVEVPVVVPMRAPSMETRRRQARERGGIDILNEHEEMDISAARASAPQPQHDLLGMSSPKLEGTFGNPFNISRQTSASDVRESVDLTGGPLSPNDIQSFTTHSSPPKPPNTESQPRHSGSYFPSRPTTLAHKSRMSYDEPRRWAGPLGNRNHNYRRFSAGGSQRGGNNPFLDEGDEGDLGYAAAEDRERMRKRVIVERLEPVKSKNPVFTWC